MTDRLTLDQAIQPGQELVAFRGYCKLAFQADGNVVLYRRDFADNWNAYWSIQLPGVARLHLLADGNLVAFAADGGVVWSPQTENLGVEFYAVQDDENFVAYGFDGSPKWSSNTYNPAPYWPGPRTPTQVLKSEQQSFRATIEDSYVDHNYTVYKCYLTSGFKVGGVIESVKLLSQSGSSGGALVAFGVQGGASQTIGVGETVMAFRGRDGNHHPFLQVYTNSVGNTSYDSGATGFVLLGNNDVVHGVVEISFWAEP